MPAQARAIGRPQRAGARDIFVAPRELSTRGGDASGLLASAYTRAGVPLCRREEWPGSRLIVELTFKGKSADVDRNGLVKIIASSGKLWTLINFDFKGYFNKLLHFLRIFTSELGGLLLSKF